jgi:prolyl oligopeptidase
LTTENRNHRLYFHRLGAPQAADELIFARPDQPDWLFSPAVSDDGRFLVLHVVRGTDPRTVVLVKDLGEDGPLLQVVGEFRAEYGFIGSRGNRLFFFTDDGAPRGRIVALDLLDRSGPEWTVIVPEGEHVIDRAGLAASGLLVIRMVDASNRLALVREGVAGEVEIGLPAPGSIVELSCRAPDDEAFIVFASFLHPPSAWRVDLGGPAAALDRAGVHHLPPGFDPSWYETRQGFATSRDGTRVPVFLTHRRGLQPGGPAPTLLYGYGGFNVSMTPAFQAHRLHWLERGGVLAWAILRGGGEYGRGWHDAGRLALKQNVFDDFIACAQWLVEAGVTTPPRLAIQGGSNGGLLVGACMTQRPELFGVALPAVGVMDMLRFHKFTIGWAWVSDYGSPEDPAEFQTLLAYSPLHNLQTGRAYPATLITTADHDDRVVPAHSFKFAAALQAAHAGDAPVLIRIQVKAGHGLGKPVRFVIEEHADIYAFTLRAMGLA